MFSIQKFFGRDPKFFELLEALAEEGVNAARSLKIQIENPNERANLHLVKSARIKSKNLHEELGELVVKTFVTAIEKEDLESLGDALYRIPKPIEKFAERLSISHELINNVKFTQQVDALIDATLQSAKMVLEVRKGGNLELVRSLNRKLQQSEAEADSLELDLLRDLYQLGNDKALTVFLLKDLYDLLERSIDRCRDVGSVVMQIVLKNS